MHQYVSGLAELKTMMHMLSDELDKGAKLVYTYEMKARVHFQKDVTIDYMNTIIDYLAWHRLATVDHCEDVKELAFPQLSKS